MKCIKSDAGVISRVNEKLAETKVKTGDFKYVPKSEWKAYKVVVPATKEVTNEAEAPAKPAKVKQVTRNLKGKAKKNK